jgi:plastocyanin
MKCRLVPLPLVFAVAACLAGAATPAQAKIVDVLVDNNYFYPEFLVINRGDTVRWVWVAGVHTSTAYDGSWDSGVVGPGSRFQYTFTGTGQFDYFCSLHVDCCDMVGTVYVLDNPRPRPSPVPIP